MPLCRESGGGERVFSDLEPSSTHLPIQLLFYSPGSKEEEDGRRVSLEDIFIHIHSLAARQELGILGEMFVQMDSMANTLPASLPLSVMIIDYPY